MCEQPPRRAGAGRCVWHCPHTWEQGVCSWNARILTARMGRVTLTRSDQKRANGTHPELLEDGFRLLRRHRLVLRACTAHAPRDSTHDMSGRVVRTLEQRQRAADALGEADGGARAVQLGVGGGTHLQAGVAAAVV